jgi:hypothetical protein
MAQLVMGRTFFIPLGTMAASFTIASCFAVTTNQLEATKQLSQIHLPIEVQQVTLSRQLVKMNEPTTMLSHSIMHQLF